MLTFILALTLTQPDSKFDPGPNPNKDVTTPVIDFESDQLKNRLKIAKSTDELVLKELALRIKTWNFVRLEYLGPNNSVPTTDVLNRYLNFFDIKQLRPWLIKKAEADGFSKRIVHKIKKLDEAKIEYALMDFKSIMCIGTIYSHASLGIKIGDIPAEYKLIVMRNKYLLDVDELEQWAKGEIEQRQKQKAITEAKEAARKSQELLDMKQAQEKENTEAAEKIAQMEKTKAESKAKEEEDKAEYLLKSAKRWLDEKNKELAERRLNELLKRYPNSKSVAEAKQQLEKLKK